MLEIKLIDGTIFNIKKEYIFIDDIFNNMNNTLDYIRIDNYIIDKNSIMSIREVEVINNDYYIFWTLLD